MVLAQFGVGSVSYMKDAFLHWEVWIFNGSGALRNWEVPNVGFYDYSDPWELELLCACCEWGISVAAPWDHFQNPHWPW